MAGETLSVTLYVESKAALYDKIVAIQTLIQAFENRLTAVIAGEAAITEEYQLDDGQMRIRTRYRSVQDLEEGIESLQRQLQRYINKYNGRGFVLRDASNLG